MKDYKMGIAKIGEDVYLVDGSTNMATKTSFDMEDIENSYLENFTQIDNIGSICRAFDAMDSDVYDDLHNMINIESDNPITIVDAAIDYIKNLDSNKIYPISINAFDSQIEINDIDNDGTDIRYYNETKIYDHSLRMSSKTLVKLLKNFMIDMMLRWKIVLCYKKIYMLNFKIEFIIIAKYKNIYKNTTQI